MWGMTEQEMVDAVEAIAGPRVVVSAWVHIDRGRMLVVRPHGIGVYFLPGGLVEPGETLAQAAAREAAEEVGVQIDVEDLRPEVVVSAPAHGRPDVTVVIAVHVGAFRGVPEARGEIAEIGWVSGAPHDVNRCAEAIQRVAEHFVGRAQLTLRG